VFQRWNDVSADGSDVSIVLVPNVMLMVMMTRRWWWLGVAMGKIWIGST